MEIKKSEEIVPYLVEVLTSRLAAGEQVIWLIPGGSGIGIACEVSQKLAENGVNLATLKATLTDERYGELGHENENWLQLLQQGFELEGATTYRVLQNGLTLSDTVSAYDTTLGNWLETADYSVGMFGIGRDGHIAGIKPHSPAVTSAAYVSGYEWEDFTRITSTPKAIKVLNEATAYAVGPEKAATLRSLVHENEPLDVQPAQILKQVLKQTLFTDYNEG